jgi:hypothetical protein
LLDPSDADDLTALEDEHLEALGALIFQPSRYLQRVVEHLSFLTAGGERWQREIQLRVPTLQTPNHPKDGRCIVSLGMFRRSRFPDFTVKDASGERLNLVTRRQHQHCITMSTLRQYLEEDDWVRAARDAKVELRTLYGQMASIITDINGPNTPKPEDIGNSARTLMAKLGKSDTEAERVSSMLEMAGELLARYTHYLCWVPASWGDTLSLSITYTMSDTVRVAGARRKALDTDEMHWWTRIRTRFYTSLSLFPVLYELRAPAHDHAGSYYFTIEPPEDAHVSILDWGHDRSMDGKSAETDCAFTTCHIHNGEQLVKDESAAQEIETDDEPVQRQSIAGAKISAFLRADPIDHAALGAVALLNIGLAYLAQRGEFTGSGNDSQQQWLLLAPTLVVALIAQHRRRYYSSVTRSVRIGLWIYLAINALFGASVAFDISGGDTYDDLASGAMAVFSLALVALLIASSGLFERITNRPFRDSEEPVGPGPTDAEPEGGDQVKQAAELDPSEEHGDEPARVSEPEPVEKYMKGVRRYADVTIATMLLVAVLGFGGTQLLGWGEERRDSSAANKAAKAEQVQPGPQRQAHGNTAQTPALPSNPLLPEPLIPEGG